MISCSRNPGVFAFSMPDKPGKVDHIFHFRSTRITTVYNARSRGAATGIRCCGGKKGREDCVPRNYYELLGVSTDSTPQQIKDAYRSLQKKHHPDIAGQKGHDYTLMLNQAYRTLMREESRSRYDTACGRRSEWSGSKYSGLGYSSWNGPLRSQALFVDEHRCIGCRECVHHASETFEMDEAFGSARVKVQFGDHAKNIEVSVDSCPVNCIHWVDAEELPLLEFLVRPQPKQAYGVFGGGWERPADVFAAAKSLKKQLKEHKEKKRNRDRKGDAEIEPETTAQTKARYHASMKLQFQELLQMFGRLGEFFVAKESKEK
ncbi:unnamed protein product [Musa textilis]